MYSTYWPLHDWCRVYHPNDNDMTKCALSYLHHYQVFDNTGWYYGDYGDNQWFLQQFKYEYVRNMLDKYFPTIDIVLDYFGKFLLLVGIWLFSTSKTFKPVTIQVFAFVLNMLLHMPHLWKNGEYKYGIDYTAYINQAGQFAMG